MKGTLQNILKYPLYAYVKYNGFLGIVGYDKEKDKLLITSKSSLIGSFSDNFRRIFGDKVTDQNAVKEYLKENNLSFIFEVIDPVKDPHIIEYQTEDIVLLDAIYRNMDYKKVPYDKLVEIGKLFNLKVKELAYTFNSWSEFYKWQEVVKEDDYKYKGEHIEGFTLEDNDGFMFKMKLAYYNTWKFMRGVKDSVGRYGSIKFTGALVTEEQNKFYGWLRELTREELKKDIITLRKMFFWQLKTS